MTLPTIAGRKIVIVCNNPDKLQALAGNKNLPDEILIKHEHIDVISELQPEIVFSDCMNIDVNYKCKVVYIVNENSNIYEPGGSICESGSSTLPNIVKLRMLFRKRVPEIRYHTTQLKNNLLPLLCLKFDERHIIYSKHTSNLTSKLFQYDIKYVVITDKDREVEREGKYNMFSKDMTIKVCITNVYPTMTIKEVANLHLLDEVNPNIFLNAINKKRLLTPKIDCYLYFEYQIPEIVISNDKDDLNVGFVKCKGLCVIEK